MLVGVREGLMRERTQLTNRIRGYGAEFGLVAPNGVGAIGPLLARIAADQSVPPGAQRLFAALAEDFARLQVRIREVDAELMAWHRANPVSRALAEIPGVGPIGACLLVMKLRDPGTFKSGRQFAAWLGLTPKDHSTAGKTRLGVITRAGDETLRSTLVVGATAVIRHVRERPGKNASPWLVALLKRKEPKLAAVALANKIARTAWAMMATGEAYDSRRALAA
jgi:transposase